MKTWTLLASEDHQDAEVDDAAEYDDGGVEVEGPSYVRRYILVYSHVEASSAVHAVLDHPDDAADAVLVIVFDI